MWGAAITLAWGNQGLGGHDMNLKNAKYIQRSKSKRFDVIFPECIKIPRRLGRYDTLKQAQDARDEYLAKMSTSRHLDKTKLDVSKHFYFVAFADTHAGHIQGLLNPDVKLDDDGETIKLKLNKTQKWLWEFYESSMAQVLAIAKDKEVILGHLGDLTQGAKFQDALISTRPFDQWKIAYHNFLPWFDKGIRKAIILKGTSSHSFGDGSSDLLISEWLKAKYQDAKIKSVYHALLQLGVEFDIAHHGPHPGSRNWLKGNTARLYLVDRLLDAITAQQEPSRIYIRAHYHNFVWETIHKFNKTADLIILPSFCGLGAYGRQATRSVSFTQHGFVLFEIKNKRLVDIYPIVEKRDARVKVYL